MLNYLTNIKLFVKRILLIFVFMTATRLLFYAMNSSHFCLSFSELLLHLFYGLKFDMVSITLANLLFVLMSIVPVSRILDNRIYQKVLKIIFLTTNIAILACNFVDCKFYEWEEKRLTADIFTPEWMGDDFLTLLPRFFTDYWPLFLLFAATAALFVWLYPNHNPETRPRRCTPLEYAIQSVVALLIMALTALASRGSLGEKPLRIMAAANYTTPERMPLILNSSFTIFKTLGNNVLPQYNYFADDQLEQVYTPLHTPDSTAIGKGKNVVIIILESFGREYSALLNNSKTGYTPNLDSLMQLGLYCTNAYANGKRSIEAIPSVMASLPALLDKAFITSTFASNQIDGIATPLRRRGYTSAFFHGGANGTMSFDSFTSLAGFERYYGFNEYPDKSDSDNYWGIFDEPFEQFMVSELSTFKQPFVAGLFTLSSHHPYTIPEQHKGRFQKGHLVNLESIGYADYALGRFFESASKTDWYNNTLFVLTADHTAQSESEFYQSTVGHYAVPLIFICPSDSSMHGVYTRTAQQTDIMPTILDYVGCDEPFVAFGNSLFDTAAPRFAVSYLNGLYQLIDDERCVIFDGDEFTTSMEIKKLHQYDGIDRYANGYQFVSIGESLKRYKAEAEELLRNRDAYLSKNKADEQNLQLLKGIIQQYNSRMQNNELSAKRNKIR
ncbi:MAG: sulfatase-like hydrolase/transferase [Salinivirgaceae bacterium]|nr:sulfatase-like hydrolase/transferase [Salinivirgaceae bacterium]